MVKYLTEIFYIYLCVTNVKNVPIPFPRLRSFFLPKRSPALKYRVLQFQNALILYDILRLFSLVQSPTSTLWELKLHYVFYDIRKINVACQCNELEKRLLSMKMLKMSCHSSTMNVYGLLFRPQRELGQYSARIFECRIRFRSARKSYKTVLKKKNSSLSCLVTE